MQKNMLVIAVVLIVAVIAITGVLFVLFDFIPNATNAATSNLNNATMVANQFYSDIKANNFQATYPLLDSLLIQNLSQQNTNQSAFLNEVNGLDGNIINYTLINWNTTIGVGSGSGTFYTNAGVKHVTGSSIPQVDLVYNVTRTKYKTQELIILIKDNSTAPFRILHYEISKYNNQ